MTEVNLAPEQNGAPLRALHAAADWVIVLSELPIHRALEVFDRNVVRDPRGVEVLEKAIAARGRKPMPESYVMADIPEGSEVIQNPVGAAPGFIINGRVYVFPGVPSEMKAMFDLVRSSFAGKKLIVDWLIVQMPESAIVKDLNEAVRMFPAVTFGSYPSTVVKIKMKSYDE